MNSEPQIVNLEFSCRLEQDSPYWLVGFAFSKLDSQRQKERLLEAVTAYWLPQAEYAQSQDWQAARYQAWEGIARLSEQIDYLSETFELDGEVEKTSDSYPKPKEIHFDLRLRTKCEFSPKIKLFRYLMSQETVFKSSKILLPYRAFWEALAVREMDLLAGESLKALAARCIRKLEQHIEILKGQFELSVPSFPEAKGEGSEEEKRDNWLLENPNDEMFKRFGEEFGEEFGGEDANPDS